MHNKCGTEFFFFENEDSSNSRFKIGYKLQYITSDAISSPIIPKEMEN